MTPPDIVVTRQLLYFYLSYARSAPTSNTSTDIDHWVRMLYQDLSAEVRKLATLPSQAQVGFYDGLAPAGSDWAAAQTEALSAAEVFIPLYSPHYLDKQWSLRERESFRLRLANAPPAAQPGQHILPVLWIPLPPTETSAEVAEALEIGEGIPEYAEDGLRALHMLSFYRLQCKAIVKRLAERVVHLAHQAPLGYSTAPAVSAIPEIKPQATNPYVIAVVAPTTANCPAGAPAESYGESSTMWRPFGAAQAQPIAVYAATVAERLGLPTRTIGISEISTLGSTWPGVLLIDPWILETETGESTLLSVLAVLPQWVKPLVVADTQEQPRANELRKRVEGMLGEFGDGRASAESVDQFVNLMPALVSDTRRRYLRTRPGTAEALPRGEGNDE
jgi:FxsC-like protein